jgi:hypothetical protein
MEWKFVKLQVCDLVLIWFPQAKEQKVDKHWHFWYSTPIRTLQIWDELDKRQTKTRLTCDRTLYCGSLARLSSFRCKIIIFFCKIWSQPYNAFQLKNFRAMFCFLANTLFLQDYSTSSQLSKVEGEGCRMFLRLCFQEILQKKGKENIKIKSPKLLRYIFSNSEKNWKCQLFYTQ